MLRAYAGVGSCSDNTDGVRRFFNSCALGSRANYTSVFRAPDRLVPMLSTGLEAVEVQDFQITLCLQSLWVQIVSFDKREFLVHHNH